MWWCFLIEKHKTHQIMNIFYWISMSLSVVCLLLLSKLQWRNKLRKSRNWSFKMPIISSILIKRGFSWFFFKASESELIELQKKGEKVILFFIWWNSVKLMFLQTASIIISWFFSFSLKQIWDLISLMEWKKPQKNLQIQWDRDVVKKIKTIKILWIRNLFNFSKNFKFVSWSHLKWRR